MRERLFELGTLWSDSAPPQSTADPSRVAEVDLPRHLTDLMAAGGKRLRPVLAFLGHGAAGGGQDIEEVTRIGAALELLHTFALAQDDVMDDAATRRGQPTVHALLTQRHHDCKGVGDGRRYGQSMAVLAGDLAHAEAQALMAGGSPAVQRHWHAMVVELVHGQTLDLTGAAWRVTDPERALMIARLKSGAYTIQRPLELGALAGGADPAVLDRMAEYGGELGLAFALRDDVLGVWGDPDRTGKPAGDDLVEGKPTLIMALATQRLGDHPTLEKVGTPGLTSADVQLLQRMLVDCGVREELEDRIHGHLARALAALGSLASPVAPAATDAAADHEGFDPIGALAAVAHRVACRDR